MSGWAVGTLSRHRGTTDRATRVVADPTSAARSRWLLLTILAVAIAGFALRVAAAGGGLWLDEAWSAVFARDVATPAGVFVHINHDNNHHLNTLWLQLVGFDAPPRVQRALSIVSGTASIIVAAAFAARRNVESALITAALFAFSPILVTYGSEARGYAPMILALLGMVLVVDGWLASPERPRPTLLLAVLALLGTLSQMTMAIGLVALSGWILLASARQEGWRTAILTSIRLIGPALAAALGVIVCILAVLPDSAGFTFGQYQPFAWADFASGLHQLAYYTLGSAILLALPLPWLVVGGGRDRAWPFYLLAIVGVPLTALLFQPGNVGMARYYLTTAVAFLLAIGVMAGRAWRAGGVRRFVVGAGLLLFAVATGVQDMALVTNRRADPGLAIAAMAKPAPGGAAVSLDRPRASAVIEAAAAAAGYRVGFAPCGRFLFVDRDGDQPFPAAPLRCGRRYTVIAGADPTGLSGTHWRLYAVAPSS